MTLVAYRDRLLASSSNVYSGGALRRSNSHYQTDFGVSSAEGAGNTKIGFLKARQRRAFKKPIFIMRIAVCVLIIFSLLC